MFDIQYLLLVIQIPLLYSEPRPNGIGNNKSFAIRFAHPYQINLPLICCSYNSSPKGLCISLTRIGNGLIRPVHDLAFNTAPKLMIANACCGSNEFRHSSAVVNRTTSHHSYVSQSYIRFAQLRRLHRRPLLQWHRNRRLGLRVSADQSETFVVLLDTCQPRSFCNTAYRRAKRWRSRSAARTPRYLNVVVNTRRSRRRFSRRAFKSSKRSSVVLMFAAHG